MAVAESELIDIVAKESLTDKAKLSRDARLGDLGIESIDLISILFVIEEKYGVRIEEADIPRAETLGEMLDSLLARINQASAA